MALIPFFSVKRPDPILPDSTLDEELQKCADEANLTLYFVNMVVVSASDLANTDMGLVGDKSDPYVQVQVGDIQHKTPTIQNDLNPVWNQKMSFFVPEKPTQMHLQVKDENSRLKDDHVGSAVFEFGSFFDIGGHWEGDLDLTLPNSEETKGSIQIHVQCRTLKPVETEIRLGYAEKRLGCLGRQQEATVAALDESEELRKQVVQDLDAKSQEILTKAEELEAAVLSHNQQLSAKDQALLDRAQEIEAKIQEKEEAEVARRQTELKKQQVETKLTEAEKEILEKAALLESKERENKEALTEKEKEVLAMADQLEVKERIHADVEKRLSQVESLKVEVENELTSKEKIIQEQAKQLDLKAKEHGEALSKKEQELVEKAKALDEKDAAAKEAQKMQDATAVELAALRKQHANLQAKVAEAESKCGCAVM